VSKSNLLNRKRDILVARNQIIQSLREFFRQAGYIEVETPHRIPALAPEFHLDAEPADNWFLHPSPEICMKRLVAAGWHQIYQICKCFRRGERGSLHLPEFTLLEWYRAGADYFDLMKECEHLIRFVARQMGCPDTLSYSGKAIDLSPPWERITLREAFDRYATLPLEAALEEDVFEEVLVDRVEPQLGMVKPTFLYDYPLAHGALAKRKKENPYVVERFELYMAGIELANAFSELTDPEEQRKRFTDEEERRRRAGKVPYPMPEKFLQSLAHMPETAGCAMGIDRLVMLFTDSPLIDLCVTFTPEEL